jgi:acyl carrier protein
MGGVGELAVSAPCLARGYLGEPVLTAERFVPDPFDGAFRGRLYRTGDRCRVLADGRIVFVGRADRQVKVRGFRVELGEVESVLIEHPHADQVVVTSVGERRLAAYIVARPGVPRDPGEFRDFARARLPDYMVPSTFLFLDRVPLTANGKVDTSSLPEPAPSDGAFGGGDCSPRNEAESVLLEMLAELLETEAVGVFDDLFELGADSLTTMRLASRIRDRFGLELSFDEVFERRTIAELASVVSGHDPS